MTVHEVKDYGVKFTNELGLGYKWKSPLKIRS